MASRFAGAKGLAWPALALLALLAMYVPTFTVLALGLWTHDAHHTHGPIVLVAALALLVVKARDYFAEAKAPAVPAPAVGWPILILGLLMYVIGRSQNFSLFDAASLIPVLLGCALIFYGKKFAASLWFAFFFLIFVIPVPGSVIDAITQPLKVGVSILVENLLFALGYPIGRAGVVLSIGQYVLMVADACSGLNSFLMLEAFGLLYMNVVRHPSVLRNVVLAILILPLSFVANTLRVTVLVLLTYYYGEEAGNGFLHGASGLLMFGVAFLIICGGDAAARAVSRRFSAAKGVAA